MSKVAIKIRGLTAADLERRGRRYSRILAFPDGISRLVRMSAHAWHCFDWLCQNGYEENALLEYSLRIAHDDFPYLSGTIEEEIHLAVPELVTTWYEINHGTLNVRPMEN